jgi:hypothetical protein
MACGLVTIKNSKVLIGIAIIVIIFIFLLICPNSQAQTSIAFKPTDIFLVPAYSGSISFGVNGTYSAATFENNTWTFTNLHLNGSQPLKTFQISTQNSNVTISSYVTSNNTGLQTIRLRYAVEGPGEQILNLGLSPQEAGSNPNAEWTVTVNNNVFLAEGEGWSISHDGTMIVNGASGTVSIVHYSMSNSNLPFFQQHSVAVAISTALAIVVAIAIVIKVKNREQPGKSELVKVVRQINKDEH